MTRLSKKIERLIKNPNTANPFLSFEWFMHGISIFYSFVSIIRYRLYKAGILKERKLPCPIISVGNITVGGTGKTPMAIYLAGLLRRMGYRPAVLSRGYKGRFEQNGGIVSDGEKIWCSPEEAGDEPYMIAEKIKVPVIVGKYRYASGITAINKFIEAGYDVHINFSPVVVYDGWLEDYSDLFALVNGIVKKEYRPLVKAEVIFLTHNAAKHHYNLENELGGEELLWKPEIQESKKSQYGGFNIRYKHDLKAQYIKEWTKLHDQIIPWNKIRYIF